MSSKGIDPFSTTNSEIIEDSKLKHENIDIDVNQTKLNERNIKNNKKDFNTDENSIKIIKKDSFIENISARDIVIIKFPEEALIKN